MYVYLKLGPDVRLIPNVSLCDGCVPMVGKVGGELQLEPAIWFKSFIIDSILLDCDLRELRWCKDPGDSGYLCPEMRLRLAVDQQIELIDFCHTILSDCVSFISQDMEDLFDSAIKIFDEQSTWNLVPPSCVARVDSCDDIEPVCNLETCEEILRLVHCYILPSVPLMKRDLAELQTAQIYINTCIENTDEEINKKDKAITLTETSLCKQRETLVHDSNFENEEYIRGCNPDFIMVFLHHIEKDVANEHEMLSHLQSQVNDLRDSTREEDKRSIDVLRSKRDKAHENMQTLCLIRENIKNAIVRPQNVHAQKKKPKKRTPKVFHEIYLEITNRLRMEKENIHKLCLKKLKISSVREAISLAIDELESTGESVGWQTRYDGTGLVTDVLGALGKPKQWLSIPERIAEILYDVKSQSYYCHNHFCETICEKISGSIDEVRFFENIVIVEPVGHAKQSRTFDDEYVDINIAPGVEDSCSVDADPSTRDFCRSLSSQSSTKSLNTPTSGTLPIHAVAESVKVEIKKHMDSMCTLLFQAIQSSNNPELLTGRTKRESYKRIWLCYEPHLYERLRIKLNHLYEIANLRKSSALAEKLSSLTVQNLGIDEPWLTGKSFRSSIRKDPENTMVKRPENNHNHVMDGDPRCPPRRAAVSATLSQLSLDELYSIAHQDCVEIPEFIDSVFDPDSTDPKVCSVDTDDSEDERNALTSQFAPPPYEEVKDLPDHTPVLHSAADPVNKVTHGGDDDSSPVNEALDSTLEPFRPVYDHIKDTLFAGSIVAKIQSITKAFDFINVQVSKQRGGSRSSENPYMPCCDDILTMVIVILTKLKPHAFTRLYAHLNMMIDLMPSFIGGSVHDCSLTNFHSAFQYLFDRTLLENTRSSRNMDRM